VKNESRIKIILRTADVDFNAQRICDWPKAVLELNCDKKNNQ
jgi:hypothetical protein